MSSASKNESEIGKFLKSLFNSERLGSQVVFQKILPATPPDWAEPQKPWPAAIQAVLRSIELKIYTDIRPKRLIPSAAAVM